MTSRLPLETNTESTAGERDAQVTRLWEELLEIEQRLIPTGLHVFGSGAELQEKEDLLRMVASFERPEHGTSSLPKLVAEGLGIDEDLLGDSSAGETKELIDGIVSETIWHFCACGADQAAAWLYSNAS